MARITPFTRSDYVFTAPRAGTGCAGDTIPYLETQGKTPCDARAEDFAYLAEAAAERSAAAGYILDCNKTAWTPTAQPSFADPAKADFRSARNALNLCPPLQGMPPSGGFAFLSAMPSASSFLVPQAESIATAAEIAAAENAFFDFSVKDSRYNTFQSGFPSCDLCAADYTPLYSRLGTLNNLVLPVTAFLDSSSIAEVNYRYWYIDLDGNPAYIDFPHRPAHPRFISHGCSWSERGEDEIAIPPYSRASVSVKASPFFLDYISHSIFLSVYFRAHVIWEETYTDIRHYDFGILLPGSMYKSGPDALVEYTYTSIRAIMDAAFAAAGMTRTGGERQVVCDLRLSHVIFSDFFQTGL